MLVGMGERRPAEILHDIRNDLQVVSTNLALLDASSLSDDDLAGLVDAREATGNLTTHVAELEAALRRVPA